MHFWQEVSFTETDQIVDAGKHCESAGFRGIGIAEHLGEDSPAEPAGRVRP